MQDDAATGDAARIATLQAQLEATLNRRDQLLGQHAAIAARLHRALIESQKRAEDLERILEASNLGLELARHERDAALAKVRALTTILERRTPEGQIEQDLHRDPEARRTQRFHNRVWTGVRSRIAQACNRLRQVTQIPLDRSR
jgi:hypothetical protein